MEIKIFVVKTKLENQKETKIGKFHGKPKFYSIPENKLLEHLEVEKRELARLFGGLTVIPNCSGLFDSEIGLESDKVEIWLIYANKTERLEYQTVLPKDLETSLLYILKLIKGITDQKSQAYAIDNEIHFI